MTDILTESWCGPYHDEKPQPRPLLHVSDDGRPVGVVYNIATDGGFDCIYGGKPRAIDDLHELTEEQRNFLRAAKKAREETGL